jgi:cytochrome c biogenesis protein CcdA
VTFWEYLDRAGERRAKLALERPINLRLLANVIGCAIVFGFLGSLVTLFIIPIPEANKDLITYMVGQLSGFAGGIVAYHYTAKAGERELETQRTKNTSDAFKAVTAALKAPAASDAVADAADRVADAATSAADEIKGD